MNILYNNPRLKKFRRALRSNQTEAESLLWQHIRNKQINNLKFYRQYSLGKYILDFYCPKKRLAIEIDGGQHDEKSERLKDDLRSDYLKSQDVKVTRFWNNDVLENLEGVIDKILEELKK